MSLLALYQALRGERERSLIQLPDDYPEWQRQLFTEAYRGERQARADAIDGDIAATIEAMRRDGLA